MVKHGIGERILPKNQVGSFNELILFERHNFAYEQIQSLASGKKTLEIGCGTAYGTEIVAPCTLEMTALDIDEDLISQLKKTSDKINYVLFDGKKIPFGKETYDLIFAFQVLEHIDDDMEFLKEVGRVLRPQGKMVLTTPNRLLRLKPGQKPFNNYHVREYAPQELHDLIKKAGFKGKIDGIFGDEKTQQFEIRRLKKYHTWFYRHIFQRFPSNLQRLAKTGVLKIMAQKKSSLGPHIQLKFKKVSGALAELSQAIDLWAEFGK